MAGAHQAQAAFGRDRGRGRFGGESPKGAREVLSNKARSATQWSEGATGAAPWAIRARTRRVGRVWFARPAVVAASATRPQGGGHDGGLAW